MNSMSSVIKQHNYKVLSTTESVDRLCNCRNKENCPLDGKCLQTCIVYKADVITNKDSHIYYGHSDGEFKSRYNNHTNSFPHRYHKQDTELWRHIWKLQDKGINFNVKWSIAAYASMHRCGSRKCDLCLTEKYAIARAIHKNLLSKKTELISKCRHRNQNILHFLSLRLYKKEKFFCTNEELERTQNKVLDIFSLLKYP